MAKRGGNGGYPCISELDARDSLANPPDAAGASFSTDGGLTFTRLTTANIFVRYSTDNGNSWTNERQITNGGPFIRNVQITGDLLTGDVCIMDEGGGGFPHNCSNLFYRSTEGGNSWSNTYTGPTFGGPGLQL